MHKKFEVNGIKIKGGCQSYTKAAPRESCNDLTLVFIFLIDQVEAGKKFQKLCRSLNYLMNAFNFEMKTLPWKFYFLSLKYFFGGEKKI